MAILKIKNALGEFVNIVALKGDKGDTGEQGAQGPKGDKGDKPAHRWIDTSLQFEKPDGTWGDAVNLKGESGDGSGNMHTSIYDTTGKSTDIFNYVDTGLSGKVDNARVLTDVPADAVFTDTVYTHPATHSADMIVDGTTNKAYTATEKNKLAGIETGANKTTIANNLTETEPGKALDATQGKELAELVSTKSGKSTMQSKTLAAASWTGAAPPYSYSLSVTGVTTTSVQEILPTTDITYQQLTALIDAIIQDGGQSSNTIVLKAWGEKPTIDIPIRVILRGDM